MVRLAVKRIALRPGCKLRHAVSQMTMIQYHIAAFIGHIIWCDEWARLQSSLGFGPSRDTVAGHLIKNLHKTENETTCALRIKAV